MVKTWIDEEIEKDPDLRYRLQREGVVIGVMEAFARHCGVELTEDEHRDLDDQLSAIVHGMPTARGYRTAADLTPQEREDASAVLRRAHVGCDEGGALLLAVHDVLSRVRARSQRSAN